MIIAHRDYDMNDSAVRLGPHDPEATSDLLQTCPDSTYADSGSKWCASLEAASIVGYRQMQSSSDPTKLYSGLGC
jgi:hypothetical protein